MKAPDSSAAHARDLGYLARFLDKLLAEAQALGGPRGLRLQALLAEEQGRWREIQALLDGGEPEAAVERAPEGKQPPARSPSPGSGPTEKPASAWTVGGLQA